MTFDLPNVYKKHIHCSVFKICYHFFVNECLNTWNIIICTHFPTAFFSVDLREINLFSFIFYYNCIKDTLSVYCCWIGAKIAKSKYVLWISFSCFFFDYSTWIFIVWIKTMLTDNNAYFKTFKTFFETQLNYSFYKTNQVNSVLKI